MMAAQVWDANLPPDWTCSVTSDGRIFFLNESSKESSWLHPVTKIAVQTGHRSLIDLPLGWERGVTTEGVPYYIDHNNQQTTLLHPITGRSDVVVEAIHSSFPESPRNDSSSFTPNAWNGTLPDVKKQTNKRSNVGSWVKGPFLRRPAPTSITHQGWLLKQGADGFQLWKRRWFVLSDYCLYYYKSPHEDKVLGYIPLPSFKIRPVCPEDRVFKRFAFKAEHENTRSYYFASETKEHMTQWMNALSLASILQKDTSLEEKSNNSVSDPLRGNRPSVSSITSSNTPTSPSADDSDSGFHGYRSKRFLSHESKSPVIFESEHRSNDLRPLDAQSFDEVSHSSRLTADRLNISVESSQGLRPGNRQPFYANAPPKPRRLNTSYEYSSTPDRSPLPEKKEFVEPIQHFHQPAPDPSPAPPRKAPFYSSSSERRTPEAYGATSTASRGDYEDVYGGTYESHYLKNQPHQRESLASSRSGGTRLSEELNLSGYSQSQFHSALPTHKEDSLPRNWHQAPRREDCPPRSHSADFLEYDRKHGPSNMIAQNQRNGPDVLVSRAQAPRPKSTVGYYHEGDFWSEENYAAKMRESSIYKKSNKQNLSRHKENLSYSNRGSPSSFSPVNHQQPYDSPVGQRVPPLGAATPDLYLPQNVPIPQKSPNRTKQSKSSSLKRGTDPLSPQQYEDSMYQGYQSTTSNISSDHNGNNFLRSASARIARNVRLDDSINTSFPEDSPENDKKLQQREESMKRLLEWKQRMLQSPLTRKSSSRPDSSASSTASSKANNTYNQPHYESESYRLQVLKELTSQEMQTQVFIGEKVQDISRSSSANIVNGLPQTATSSTIYSPQTGKSQGERPIPQGGSEDSNDVSGVSLNGTRKRDGKRDHSRARHISGGDSRRSTSSSNRYNSYSSDEQDVLEDRNTRRKTRKNSRRSNSDQKSDSKQSIHSNSKSKHNLGTSPTVTDGCSKTSASSKAKAVGEPYNPEHDYVNINTLDAPPSTLSNKTKLLEQSNGLDKSGSERAVPVFIDDNDDWKREESKNIVFNDKYFAARDPYYVADVQIPTKSDIKLSNGYGSDIMYGNRASPIGFNGKDEGIPLEPEYENASIINKKLKDERKETPFFQVAHSRAADGKFNSQDTKVLQYDPVYETSNMNHYPELKNDHVYNNNYKTSAFKDDNSIGKYSDSGYDTLRAELPQKKDEKRDSNTEKNEKAFEDSVAARKGSSKVPKRPETWSPDKFDRSWNGMDSTSKVEESQIVKEYSYEYITPEKNIESTQSNLKDMSLNLNISSPNLPTLESPRMVQETQAATNKNIVKDRIKGFSFVNENHQPNGKLYIDNSNYTNGENTSEIINNTSHMCNDRSKIISETYDNNMCEEFVSSVSTKIATQEAQVKILSDSNNSDELGNHISSNEENNSCSELSSLEYRDLKSPQDIMDSRLNRLNIRKFVFDEGDKDASTVPTEKPESSSTVKNKRSVKELLKSFESKLEDVQDNYSSTPKEEYKRKFYSDSELLSNESSSDESYRENIVEEDRLPPPPPSFLEDLRNEENERKVDITPPPRPPKKPHLSCDMDSKGRPRCIRLSLAESIEESLRIRSESENEENGWYGASPYKFKSPGQINPYHNRQQHIDNFENGHTLVIDMDKPPQVQAPPPPKMSIEENYLPMSPPKKPNHGGSSVALSSSNSSLSSKHLPTPEPMFLDQFGKTEFEEHMYIEMSGEPSPRLKYDSRYSNELPKLDISAISNAHFLSPESPRYYEIGEKDGQHYEYIYKTASHYEAIYTEVPNTDKEEVNQDSKPEIPNKPHDLKHMKPFHKKCFSDSALITTGLNLRNKASEGSSDADDEASKDLDSIELPKKPRFSLSDTFRPASYYLSGADLSQDIDAHDSSDSDLVSPPPIPMTLPPVENLGNGENVKSKKYGYDSKETSFHTPSHNSSFSSNSSKTMKFTPNDNKEFKQHTTPHYSQRRSDSGSIISNKLKRRPFLEETLDELNDDENFILRSEDIYPSSIGYPEDRSSYMSTKSSPWSKGKSSKGNFEISMLPEDHKNVSVRPSSSMSLNLSLHSKLESSFASGQHEDSFKESIYENSHIRHSSSASSIPLHYSAFPGSSKMARNTENSDTQLNRSCTKSPDTSLHNTSHLSYGSNSGPVYNERIVGDNRQLDIPLSRNLSSPLINFHQRSSSELSTQSLTNQGNIGQRTNTTNTPVHVRVPSNLSNNAEISPRTAPYYYSDVIRDENLPLFDESSHTTPRARAYQLNNQRDLEANKRQDIGRKVNQISTCSLSTDITDKERLQNELMHSFDLFDDKTTGVPDERNVYESDTLRKMKMRTLTPDPDSSGKNIYPYGISLKSETPVVPGLPSHRRSRSLEGLVDNMGPRQRKPIRDWIGSNEMSYINDISHDDPSAAPVNNETLGEDHEYRQINNSQNRQPSNSPPQQPYDQFRHHISSPHQMFVSSQQGCSPLQTNTFDRQIVSPNSTYGTSERLQRGSSHNQNYTNDRQQVTTPQPFNHPDSNRNSGSGNDSFYSGLHCSSPNSNSNDLNNSRVDQLSSQTRVASPYGIQSPQPTMDNTTAREGSTSRLSHHDTFSFGSGEETNWEDDSQWREQLRRASLRHTRSLETLDEPRARSMSDCVTPNHESRPSTKLSVANENRREVRSPQRSSLDEYHVDYREGRIPPGNFHGDSLEMNRKGLTTVEEYEWDAIEEKFKKPDCLTMQTSKATTNNINGQTFLAEGLPLSSEKDSDQVDMHKNLHMHSEMESSSSKPQGVLLDSHTEGELTISGDGGGPSRGDEAQPSAQNHESKEISSVDSTRERDPLIQQEVNIVPDIIPYQDVTKLGEALHKRSDLGSHKLTNSKFGMQSDSPLSNYSYGFGSSGYNNPNRYLNYQPHPHANNQYQYKNEDLLKYANHHPQPPQYPYPNQEQVYNNPTYQNYRNQAPAYNNGDYRANNPYDRFNPGQYQQFPSQDLQDYYHNTRNVDYGSYDQEFRETERLRQEEQMYQRQQELAYQQQYTDAELAAEKTSLAQLNNEHTEEHLQRIAYLEEHLQDLDKQYQMGKPLINLVDNMVKLGSLYRGFDSRTNAPADPRAEAYESPNQESLEFSRRILEKRILAEDRREYDSATPDQIDLEGKVMELYKLEKILQEESLTIQTLQRDKDMLERTLETLHSRAQGTNESLVEIERRNLQRDHLEKELSRLRSHLAVSARRLEDTAVENNRLEHEMMMLRQKIQANMVRNAQRETEGTSEARHIESEMLRVQSLLEHLQKRRLELSQQIQRLTSANNVNMDQRPSPTGISEEGSYSSRKKHTTWLETDLDRMITRDRGCDPPEDKRGRSPAESLTYSSSPLYSRGANLTEFVKRSNFSNPEYAPAAPISENMSRGGPPSMRAANQYRVNLGDDLPVLNLSPSKNSSIDDDLKSTTSYGSYGKSDERLRSLTSTPVGRESTMDRNALDNKPDGEEQRSSPLNLDINEADDRMKRYYGILPKEKMLEPKTVRIVKRESTERKKDRYYPSERKTSAGQEDSKLSLVDEDEIESDRSDIENYPPPALDFSTHTASLPRNYGRANPLERANMMANAVRPTANNHSTQNSSYGAMARPSNLPLRNKQPGVWKKSDSLKDRPMSAHEQLFGTPRDADQSPPLSPSKSDPPSPVFKSAAAREIIKEMAWEAEKHRRAVPREKRRHYTISSSRPLALESGSGPEEGARSRDDCDMVRALRPRNHPDVVKSTLSTRDVRFNESTIDTILGAPRKIHIPERYMPDEDDEKELSNEEKLHREQKATAIRKMLTESSSSITKPDPHDEANSSTNQPAGESSAPSRAKLDAEKKEREHILSMNQILAKQVMEKSRMVAARALSMDSNNSSSSDDDLSPMQSLPLIQQRENFLV